MNSQLKALVENAEHTATRAVDQWFNDTIRALQHGAEEMEKYRLHIKEAMRARSRSVDKIHSDEILAPPPDSPEVVMAWAMSELQNVAGNIRLDTAMTVGCWLAVTSQLRHQLEERRSNE